MIQSILAISIGGGGGQIGGQIGVKSLTVTFPLSLLKICSLYLHGLICCFCFPQKHRDKLWLIVFALQLPPDAL
ncbi:MAG TPA: hypothetical protein DDY32_12795 [Desulfobulbaceae bacterium]|nr:hypothetical protein [Desulfobulbaceae bacterium]